MYPPKFKTSLPTPPKQHFRFLQHSHPGKLQLPACREGRTTDWEGSVDRHCRLRQQSEWSELSAAAPHTLHPTAGTCTHLGPHLELQILGKGGKWEGVDGRTAGVTRSLHVFGFAWFFRTFEDWGDSSEVTQANPAGNKQPLGRAGSVCQLGEPDRSPGELPGPHSDHLGQKRRQLAAKHWEAPKNQV